MNWKTGQITSSSKKHKERQIHEKKSLKEVKTLKITKEVEIHLNEV